MGPLELLSIRRVAVGSTNPVKIGAVRAVFGRAGVPAGVEGVAAASDVPDQPRGDEQTIRGARTRAERAREALGADLGIGLEGGVVLLPDGSLRTCAWAVVVDRTGRTGTGGSLAMPLPPAIAAMIAEGLELGEAMDRLTGGKDTKYGAGASGIFTAGLVNRQAAYESLVTYALAPWLGGEHWR
jgi:inosine/xanthosine triphosphatase